MDPPWAGQALSSQVWDDLYYVTFLRAWGNDISFLEYKPVFWNCPFGTQFF